MATARIEDDRRAEVSIDEHTLEFAWVGPDSELAPLVFLHEGLGSIDLWRDFPSLICNESARRGLVFSRFGNGWSDALVEPRRPDYMHEEATFVLPQLLETLELEVPVLIGHSDGASIAIIYAGSGQSVESMILIAPHVWVEGRSIEAISAARQDFDASDRAARMAKYHRDPRATFWGWNDIWLSPAFRDWNLEEFLPSITCPLLLVQGEDDEFGTTAQLDLIESRVSGETERLMVAASGHSPHLLQSDLVMKAITQFLGHVG